MSASRFSAARRTRETGTAPGVDAAGSTGANGRIDPATVGFDVDGVIADTMRLFVDIARLEYGARDVRYEDITCYQLTDCLHSIDESTIDRILDRILDGDYTIPLEPMPGSRQVLPKIASRRLPVRLVTARPYPGPILDWMCEHMGLSPDAIELVTTGTYDHKAQVLLDMGVRCFVEDRLETCFALDQVGIRPVLFRQPWNRRPHPFLEVGTWTELDSLMQWLPDGQ